MIRIVTDSTAYVAPEVIDRFGIVVVPLRVIFPGETYRDGVDMTPNHFYRLLRSSPVLPTTSQPPAAEFVEVFRSLPPQDTILTITISSKLSGTLAAAEAARRELPERDIVLFDSYGTSAMQAFMVAWAAEQAAAGRALEDIMRGLEILRARTTTFFTVDTLEYLQKGGRIGGAAALAASILRIHPVLTLKEGRIEAWGKVRGKRKALQAMIEATRAGTGEGESIRAAVIHAACPEQAEEFRREVREALHCPLPQLAEFSPVIGVHVGPGTIGLAAYDCAWLVGQP